MKHQKKYDRETPRRREAVDSKPRSLPLNFGKPPTLAEQIAMHISASNRYAEAQLGDRSDEDDFDGPDGDWEDEAESPHELVYDEQLNRELTRFQKEHLDKQRAVFDQKLSAKIREDRERAAAIKAAEKSLDAKRKTKKPTEEPEA